MSRIRVGPAGWSYGDWEAVVYPARKGRGFDPLAYLADYFDVIEINTTFYRPPTPKMSREWCRRIAFNPDFRFTLKLWQRFTHQTEELQPSDEETFKRGIDPIAESGRLGCLLIQFPWSFRDNEMNRRRLESLIETFSTYPLVVEVRHASWDHDEAYAFLAERGVGFCNIDQPSSPRSLKPSARATSTVGYVRLHGRNYADWFREDAGRDDRYNYLYREDELDEWVDRAVRVAAEARETHVITNNHFGGKAVVNALQLLSKITGGKVNAPAPLVRAFPVLEPISLKEEKEQGNLFT